ncbi:non-structural maintenance of chromosomes element 3 homolog, partial [Varroa jacobsoni]|uniref:non-structural maintenance of chromosomes element 3 homolog n=1 Tax=Varroa jacobsoni TaxID=62625 RepID=UPI000BF79544
YFIERTQFGVKRADIVEKILQGNARLLREAVDNASRLLEDTIGYQIREVPGKRLYIVVNSLDLTGLEEHLSQDEQCEHVRGLICIILSLILMNIGETLAETDLWNFLREINIDHDDKKHPVFGDIEKLIKVTFVKQHYLEHVKKKDGPGEFSWGYRAQYEFKPMEILKFVADVYSDGKSPRDFTMAYKRISEKEKQSKRISDQKNQTRDFVDNSRMRTSVTRSGS